MSHFRASYITMMGLFWTNYVTIMGLFWANYITIMGLFWTTHITIIRYNYITIMRRNLLNHSRVARGSCNIFKDTLTVVRQASERGDGVRTGVGVISSSEKVLIEASDENSEACDAARSSSIASEWPEGGGGEVTKDIRGGGT